MTGFNAATAVEAMDYDFTAFGGSKGIIPEPSTKAVKQFFDALQAIAAEVRPLMEKAQAAEKGELSNEDISELMAAMDDDLVEKQQDRIIDAVADLCGGFPPRDEIANLPYRVLGAFNAWIGAQIRPEARRPVTTR